MKQLTLVEGGFIDLDKVKRKKAARKEESLQIRIAKYIRSQYPDVIFNSDIASGMRLPIWIAAKAKAQRSSKGQPDLIILEPRGQFHGMCVELKNGRDKVYKKDGTYISNKHLQEQHAMLLRLRNKGYWADFICSFDESKEKIDWYFSL